MAESTLSIPQEASEQERAVVAPSLQILLGSGSGLIGVRSEGFQKERKVVDLLEVYT